MSSTNFSAGYQAGDDFVQKVYNPAVVAFSPGQFQPIIQMSEYEQGVDSASINAISVGLQGGPISPAEVQFHQTSGVQPNLMAITSASFGAGWRIVNLQDLYNEYTAGGLTKAQDFIDNSPAPPLPIAI